MNLTQQEFLDTGFAWSQLRELEQNLATVEVFSEVAKRASALTNLRKLVLDSGWFVHEGEAAAIQICDEQGNNLSELVLRRTKSTVSEEAKKRFRCFVKSFFATPKPQLRVMEWWLGAKDLHLVQASSLRLSKFVLQLRRSRIKMEPILDVLKLSENMETLQQVEISVQEDSNEPHFPNSLLRILGPQICGVADMTQCSLPKIAKTFQTALDKNGRLKKFMVGGQRFHWALLSCTAKIAESDIIDAMDICTKHLSPMDKARELFEEANYSPPCKGFYPGLNVWAKKWLESLLLLSADEEKGYSLKAANLLASINYDNGIDWLLFIRAIPDRLWYSRPLRDVHLWRFEVWFEVLRDVELAQKTGFFTGILSLNPKRLEKVPSELLEAIMTFPDFHPTLVERQEYQSAMLFIALKALQTIAESNGDLKEIALATLGIADRDGYRATIPDGESSINGGFLIGETDDVRRLVFRVFDNGYQLISEALIVVWAEELNPVSIETFANARNLIAENLKGGEHHLDGELWEAVIQLCAGHPTELDRLVHEAMRLNPIPKYIFERVEREEVQAALPADAAGDDYDDEEEIMSPNPGAAYSKLVIQAYRRLESDAIEITDGNQAPAA